MPAMLPSNFGSLTTPQGFAPRGSARPITASPSLRAHPPALRRTRPPRGGLSSVQEGLPTVSGLAGGGLFTDTYLDDAKQSMPQMGIPDYLRRFDEGGDVGYSAMHNRQLAPKREPYVNISGEYPDLAGDFAKRVDDRIVNASYPQSALSQLADFFVGDSPSNASYLANKGWLPRGIPGGLAMMLASDDAAAPETRGDPTLVERLLAKHMQPSGSEIAGRWAQALLPKRPMSLPTF